MEGKSYVILLNKSVKFSAGFKKYYFLSHFKHIKMFDNLEKTALYELLMGNKK